MARDTKVDVVEELLARFLAPEELRALAERLRLRAGSTAATAGAPGGRRPIQEFLGIAPGLLGGRDAQEWVEEQRAEWDERGEPRGGSPERGPDKR